jgi:dTDP-4-amino-4,6-dideoxygalactose transaminase
MRAIRALSVRYGFRVIEDASHAIGGRYLDQPIGNCAFSDATVFSFHPVKIITSAEGGMVTTQDAQLARRMELFRSHGMTRDPGLMDHAPDGPWYYQQIELGYNYRLTDLHAALGLSQLGRMDEYVARRHALATRYDQRLAPLPLTRPWQHPDGYSGLHLYIVRVDAAKRRQVFDTLRAQGVGVNLHYIPVHTQPYYRRFGFRDSDFPNAMAYYGEAISLPMYATLSDAQQDVVVHVVAGAVST